MNGFQAAAEFDTPPKLRDMTCPGMQQAVVALLTRPARS
jgi:hypothetical protein